MKLPVGELGFPRWKSFKPGGGEGFEWVLAEDPNDYEAFLSFDGTSRKESWKPVRVRLLHSDEGQILRESDFPWLGSHALVMRARAADLLTPVLSEHGELLPLECDEATLWVFNVRRVIDALDMERSELDLYKSSGRVMQIRRAVFVPALITGVDVFKIPQLLRGPTFVSEGFVRQVESHGLSGLEFLSLWRGGE